MRIILDAQARLVRTTSQKSTTQEAIGVQGHIVAEKGKGLLFFYRAGDERVVLATSPVKTISRAGRLYVVRTTTGTTYVFSRNLKGAEEYA